MTFRLIILIFLTAAFMSAGVKNVHASVETGRDLDSDNPVRIGVSSMITPVDAVKYYQEIIDYIGEHTGRPTQMIQRKTYEEMDLMLEKGEVKIAFICSASYIINRRSFGVEPLVAPSVDGKAVYHSYIIAHKDSPIKSFPELKGMIFAFTDPRSNTGTLYPTYLLKTLKSTPEKYFGKYIYSYSHNKSVELVAKKIADGAAVDSLVYEYMLKSNSPYTRQTRIIKRSPPYGMPPLVVTKHIHPDMRKRLKETLLSMHTTEKGKRILNAMLIDRFVEIPDSAYDSIRKMEGVVWNTMDIPKDKGDGSTVHFSVIPRDNPRILYEKFQPLLDYLSETTPYRYDLVLKKNHEDTVNALGRGELDIAFLDPLTYLEAHLRYNAQTVLKPLGSDNSSTYKSAIIKRRDSPIKTLRDLKGKSVAFSALKSASGNLMPRYLLANAGIHLNELSKYENFDYHDSVVKAILRGEYDAGAVRDSVAKRFMNIGIEVIAESMPIPTDPLVSGPKTPASVTEAVKKALLELNPKNVRHQKILGKLYEEMRNGFIEASDSDYAGVRARFNAIPQTCGKACHPRIRL